jgi:hypothetical protein
LSEPDEQGRELFQYSQKLTKPLGEAFQAVLNTVVEISNYLSELSPEEIINRPYLRNVIQLLVELNEQIFPRANSHTNDKVEVSMNFNEMVGWAERLNIAQQHIFSLYLSWVSDILEEIR